MNPPCGFAGCGGSSFWQTRPVAQSANARTVRPSTSLWPPPAGDKACQRLVSTNLQSATAPSTHYHAARVCRSKKASVRPSRTALLRRHRPGKVGVIRADVFRVSIQTGEESGWRRVDFGTLPASGSMSVIGIYRQLRRSVAAWITSGWPTNRREPGKRAPQRLTATKARTDWITSAWPTIRGDR
jgi:hypothetical protein